MRLPIAGVLAQRLLRTVCIKCKEPYSPPKDAIKRLGMNLDIIDKSEVTFYRGRGCETCKGTGYKGRIGVYELMPVTDKVRELILARALFLCHPRGRCRGRNADTQR